MVEWVKSFILIAVLCNNVLAENRNIIWYGGGSKCETKKFIFIKRQCENENVIATKALISGKDIFVLTPRFKTGVPATVSKLEQGQAGVHLEPFLTADFHTVGNCEAVQNAVDFHLDVLGNLWILDTGTVETLKNPKCTCHPKVAVVNIFLQHPKVKNINLTDVVQPESILQSIVVEYMVGGSPFVYISDSGIGRIIIHDATKNVQWTLPAYGPTLLQLALIHGPTNELLAVRRDPPRWIEAETQMFRNKGSSVEFTKRNDDLPPISLLGSDTHHVYFHFSNNSDVFAWKIRHPMTNTTAHLIHIPDPQLDTISVALDGDRDFLILDTNYENFIKKGFEAIQKLSFVPRVKL